MIATVRTFIVTGLLLLWLTVSGQDVLKRNGFEFTFVNKIPCTSIKNQAKTGTCWSFSTASYLESEAFRMGKAWTDLSEMFWVRKAYVEKAQKYLRYHGKANFGQGGLSHDVLRLYQQYGAVPEEVYDGLVNADEKHNHNSLEKELKSYLDSLIDRRDIPADWKLKYEKILDQYLGVVPQEFNYEGKVYDPQSFARSHVGVDADEYVTLTSFSHHPWYSQFVLEVPDNFSDGMYINLPLQDLMQVIDHSLSSGRTIVWDCDVSEKGFSARQGLALLPDEYSEQASVNFQSPDQELEVSGPMRQQEFDSYSLTDDHLMHIVGKATDQSGKPYYYVKNSWGESPGFQGYLMASSGYMALNTIGITVHKEGVPLEIWQKINKKHMPSSAEEKIQPR